jgi:TonB family protein
MPSAAPGALAPGSRLAQCKSCDSPQYPNEEFFSAIGGTAVLLIAIDAGGNVLNVQVEKSTRNRNLDRAAFIKASHWRFKPNHVNGQDVGGYVMVPVNFEAEVPTAPTVYEGVQTIPLNVSGKSDKVKWGSSSAPEQITTVAQAHEFIKNSCAAWPMQSESASDTFAQRGEGGYSKWTFFFPNGPYGLSVVRRRYTSDDGGTVLKTSYICEGDESECKELRAHLDTGFSRPAVTGIGPVGKPWFSRCDPR